jgi:hypothetical protein
MLTESTTNPRRIFDENALKELADTIRNQGVLKTDQIHSFVAGLHVMKLWKTIADSFRFSDYEICCCIETAILWSR